MYCPGNVFSPSFLKFLTAIAVLKDKEPGSFVVRDSHSFRGAYGLAIKVAVPPPSVLQMNKKGTVCLLSVLKQTVCSRKSVLPCVNQEESCTSSKCIWNYRLLLVPCSSI